MEQLQKWKPHLCWLWLSFVFIVSVIPSYNTNASGWFGQLHFDKLFHLFSHAIAIFLVLTALKASKLEIPHNFNFILALLFMFLYGFLIELIQHNFIQGRMFDKADVIANTIGDVLGIWLFVKCGKR